MNSEELKYDGVAVVIILVAVAILGLMGYLIGFAEDEEVIVNEPLFEMVTSTPIPPPPNEIYPEL